MSLSARRIVLFYISEVMCALFVVEVPMITAMRRLNFTCDDPDCDKPAVFEVQTREPQSEDNLLALERSMCYCETHVPEYAQKWWDWMRTP